MRLKINGQLIDTTEHDPTMPLLWFLREVLQLTGTRYGCGKGQCGSCTVHINGKAMSSCLVPINQLQDADIKTIEHIDSKAAQAIKQAWCEVGVPQCGYCQSGQIMSATALLESNPMPDAKQIKGAMQRNICRCGTYPRIEQAITIAVTTINE